MIYLYCDGGCSGNQEENNIGGWGSILVYGKAEKELSGGAVNTTNNIMELTAMIAGLKAIKNKDLPVCVFSDSAYIINCFQQQWYKKWQKNNWLTSKKTAVENKSLWQELIALSEMHPTIYFFKVKGHLDPKDETTIKKWHTKFEKDYQLKLDYQIYATAVKYNNRADELANIEIAKLKGAN